MFLTRPPDGCYKQVFIKDLYLAMQTKFSEDIIPLSDLKINPGKVVNHAKNTHRPILLTSRGRGVAVVQGLEEYEKNEEEREFVKAIAQGLMEIKEGRVLSIAEAKVRLGIK
jgi:prevent-host-death family protein